MRRRERVTRSCLGDRLFAVGRGRTRAIAEYKLAQRQTGRCRRDHPIRLGHAYATRGDVDEALALLRSRSPRRTNRYRHQIASDLVIAGPRERVREAPPRTCPARSSHCSSGGIGLRARRICCSPSRGTMLGTGIYTTRAQPLPRGARRKIPRILAPTLLYETGRAYSELGGCDRALPVLRGLHRPARPDRRAEEYESARFHYGYCLFVSADEDRASGRPGGGDREARDDGRARRVLADTCCADAHFLRGEMYLSDRARTRSALRGVSARSRLESVADRSHGSRGGGQRIRQIRFGFESELM